MAITMFGKTELLLVQQLYKLKMYLFLIMVLTYLKKLNITLMIKK